MADSFMFGIIGDLLYWGQTRREKCSSCGHVQRSRGTYAARMLRRLAFATLLISLCASVGIAFQTIAVESPFPGLRNQLTRIATEDADMALFACMGAGIVILVLCADSARR